MSMQNVHIKIILKLMMMLANTENQAFQPTMMTANVCMKYMTHIVFAMQNYDFWFYYLNRFRWVSTRKLKLMITK